MSGSSTSRRSSFSLDTPRVRERVRDAVRLARERRAPVMLSLTELSGLRDPTAAVIAARRPGEPWFVLEQPDRDGAAIAALGCAHALSSRGARRFEEVSAQWGRLTRVAVAEPPGAAAGSGLIAVGGFAFAPDGAEQGLWGDFGSASLQVPELSLVREDGRVWLTLNLLVDPREDDERVLGRLQGRLVGLRDAPLALLDPDPVVAPRVRSVMPPSHYEQAVERAVERIAQGAYEKIVLAREVEVTAATPADPAALLGVMREAFSTCFVYAVGRGESVFLGATPELLVRREGQRASTVALAGSTRRSADPAVDAHLAEQLLVSEKDREENAIVARRIDATLRPHALWVTMAREPYVVKVANIQHLATPVRAQLARPLSAIELAGLLHPTPAVGGEPKAAALPAIPALEGIDRGWYAGPVGWTDASGDGEFCVALRCALASGATARLFAGCGIVRDSDPPAELAETEVKLGAMLPLLAG